MSQNKYWQSFAEANDPENFKARNQDEFKEELPFEDFDGKGLVDAKAPRRDFLKYLGFSTAAASLAASCKIPVRKAIPFANKPENIVPGEAKYYATTFIQDGDVVPVLARVRDGRPILIEGNDLSFVQGCTTARIQASVLDLYDKFRITHPKQKKGAEFTEVPTFEQLDKDILAAVRAAGGQMVLLTSTINSPSTLQLLADLKAVFPNFRHVQYDAVSYSGMLLANEASFGQRAIPTYKFENARKVVVSLGADFLGTWLSPVEYASGYVVNRKINENDIKMSRHFQFESFLSMTGANADFRFNHRPSETGAVALALAAAVGVPGVSAPALPAKLQAGITKAAAELVAAKGESLVVADSNDVNVQLVVNAINSAIGAYGSTIDWSSTVNYRKGVDSEFAALLGEMKAGSVGTIMIHGANPLYTWPNKKDVEEAFAKVKLSISFNEKLDETSALVQYVVPTHHYLESWGDAEARAGQVGFVQPTIYPLFKTRQWQESLLKWAGRTETYEQYFRAYWVARLGSEDTLNHALQDGVLKPNAVITPAAVVAAVADTLAHGTDHQAPPPPPAPVVTVGGSGSYNGGSLGTAVAAIGGAKKGGKKEVVFYQNLSLGSGSHPANPWLMELPDAITKVTWDNYAMISVKTADELNIDYKSNDYEYYPSKPVITIEVPGKEKLELPILVVPGMDGDTVAVALGYGRTKTLGVTLENVGVNVYPVTSYNGSSVELFAINADVKNAGKKYKLAQTQIHNSYEDRVDVVRETSLASFKQDKTEFKDYRDDLVEKYAKNSGNFRKEATLYDDPDRFGTPIKWGMQIDMNACFGCGACVIACHAENNVPVVGKSEVLRYHDMHWLRIDRYYVSDEKDPNELKGVVFQPMMCQHCDNAPCENVCPVAATNHSMEGLNQMTYNRCIGTRYCANNCPYKVRRFNWSDYTGADSFPNNQDQQIVGKLDPAVHYMNDDLTRMVLNPDVTVRSRGVIEKCSFCVQRLQAAKLQAKKEGVPMKDQHLKLACSSACAADAITFGNVHDPESKISKERLDNPLRTFYVLEQIHTLPNISYLAKIRNTDEIVPRKGHVAPKHDEGHGGGHGEAGHGEHKEEKLPATQPAEHH